MPPREPGKKDRLQRFVFRTLPAIALLAALLIALLLVSGVYYSVEVLPEWMQVLSRLSPATYVLEAMRAGLIDGTPVSELLHLLWPLLVMAVAFTLLFSVLHLLAIRNEIMRRRIRSLQTQSAQRARSAPTDAGSDATLAKAEGAS